MDEDIEEYTTDLDLEAEIEAFLEDDDSPDSTLRKPIWIAELESALDDNIYDGDILKSIIESNTLPEELRARIWPALLGVHGKRSSFKRRKGRGGFYSYLWKASNRINDALNWGYPGIFVSLI